MIEINKRRRGIGSFNGEDNSRFRHHTWGYIGGAAISAVGGYLSKPKAPKQVDQAAVDLQNEQSKAIGGNLANESSIENLVSRSNSFNQDQALSLAEKAMPGYTKLAGSLTNRATQLADHPYDVPKEVQDNLARIAAERGISAGTRGEFNNFSLIRDLGVNELQYGQQAISQAQSLTGLLSAVAPKVNPTSPLAFYITPSQQAAITTGNNTNAQATGQAGANASAAASNAANADLWGSLTKIAGLYVASKSGTNTGDKTTIYPNAGNPNAGAGEAGVLNGTGSGNF